MNILVHVLGASHISYRSTLDTERLGSGRQGFCGLHTRANNCSLILILT